MRRRAAATALLLGAACGGGGGGTSGTTAPPVTEAQAVDLVAGTPASATGADGGTELEATASLGADGVVELELRVTAGERTHRFTEIEWGDGVVDGDLPLDCEDEDAGGSPDRTTSTHAYRTRGDFEIEVRVRAVGESCDDTETARASFVAEVETGHGGTNGPALPAGTFVLRDGGVANGQRQVSLLLSTSDDDGWVSEVVIDWGDGAPVHTVRSTAGCVDSDDAYPRTEAYSRNIPEQIHPGSSENPTIPAITVRSSGCDGSDVQEAAAVYEEDEGFFGGDG